MKLAWIRPFLALSLAAGVAGCGHRSEGASGEESAAEAVVSVRVRAVEARTFADVVVAPGEWRSAGELVVASPASGVVETLTVAAGDQVSAGTSAGSLVTRGSWAALHGAELLVREARDPGARAEAERALALARRDLVRVPLVIRQAGVVLRRSVEPGAEVAEGAEILSVAPRAAIVFEAHVPAAEARRVRAGQSAVVRAPDSSARAARVSRLLPVASDADQSSLVWLAPAGGSMPALERFGAAEITVGPPHRSLAVPDPAIVEDDLTGEHRVAAVDSAGRLSWHAVTLGAGAEGWRELVRSDLAAGARVVIEGHRGLPEGTRVTARP